MLRINVSRPTPPSISDSCIPSDHTDPIHNLKIMSSTILERTASQDDIESGYASATSETGGFADIYFTKPHLKYLNKQLSQLEPQGMCSPHEAMYAP